jgi:hypothetical protein
VTEPQQLPEGVFQDARGRLVNEQGQRVRLKQKRHRGLRESLVSIVMGCEVFVAFLVAIGLVGLGATDPVTGYVGGGVFILLALVAAGRAAKDWAVGLSGALQVVAVLSGLLEPILFLVGAGFLAFWLYAVIMGTRIDRRNAAIAAAEH